MEKTQLFKRMKIKRSLTKNEKNLLILLGIIIILWAVFSFIVIPQYKKIQSLTDQKNSYEEEILQMNHILNQENEIEREWDILYKEKTKATSKYLSNLNQSQIIYLLNDILDNEGINILDINFSKPNEEQIGDLMFDTMDISIPYKGTYTGLFETVQGITLSPKNIVISQLIMDRDKEDLVGNINLRIYGLENIDSFDEEDFYIDTSFNNDKSSPFKPFDSYSNVVEKEEFEEGQIVDDNKDNQNINIQGDLVEKIYHKDVLEDFETGDFHFIPSNQNIKGDTFLSSYSKFDENSLKLEYDILALEDENRAYIDLSNKNIITKYPPSTIGVWIYSYGYSPATLGIRMKGQASEQIDIELSQGISWLGWEYVEVVPPEDLSLYPLQVDKIYLELDYNRDDYGVLLFDRLEANYPKDSEKSSESFNFHIVEEGESLDEISIHYYGTTAKKDIIMKYNEIKTNYIQEGKILVIPR